MNLLVPVVLASVLAFFSYIVLERLGVHAWLPASCRAVGWAAIALLVVNPSCPIPGVVDRPLVLLDASLSMSAAGARWDEARAAAFVAGDVRTFGDPFVAGESDSIPTLGRSLLANAIATAAASGRPLVIVTDGEIDDVPTVPPDLLKQSSIRVFPREAGPAATILSVTGPNRVLLRDSIRLRLQLRTAGLPGGGSADGSLALQTRLGERVLARTNAVGLGSSSEVEMTVPASALGPGEHLLEIALVDTVGREWRDDRRLHYVRVADSPGIVVVASPGDWEARFLLRTLRDVTALPVEGFVELAAGRWHRMSDLSPVTPARVREAYRLASVGVRLGSPSVLTLRPRAEWIWPRRSPVNGDWYVSAGRQSPLGATLAGWNVDSFPPATSVMDDTIPAAAWVALTAQLGRRGTPRPVFFGREIGGRREITTLGRGMWRWSFRGEASEQAYRAIVSSSVDWLLGAEPVEGPGVLLNRRTVPRGLPLIFSVSAGSDTSWATVPVQFRSETDGTTIEDSLRFDEAGTASLYLPPGRYVFSFPNVPGGSSASGVVAVEGYSEEWFPHEVTLQESRAVSSASGRSRAARETLWPFGLALAALSAEWVVRRRRGLR
jgi:hypothetical protein